MAEKDSRIYVRVSETEKKLIENKAKLAGFDSISAYVLFLIRNDNVTQK